MFFSAENEDRWLGGIKSLSSVALVIMSWASLSVAAYLVTADTHPSPGGLGFCGLPAIRVSFL